MSRKRRVDAKFYEFQFFDCENIVIEKDGKTYVYETVLIRRAKNLTGYEQPVYSLYRDLHKSTSAKVIYGVRAICIEDFNKEGFCCKVKVYKEKGKDALFIEDEL